jgi:hypothetical protein
VIAGVSRTHRLAGRIVALLAKHRLKANARVGELTFPIALYANPVLGAAAGGFVRARGTYIVFGVAGDYTGFAARAAIEVDDHGPFMSH